MRIVDARWTSEQDVEGLDSTNEEYLMKVIVDPLIETNEKNNMRTTSRRNDGSVHGCIAAADTRVVAIGLNSVWIDHVYEMSRENRQVRMERHRSDPVGLQLEHE